MATPITAPKQRSRALLLTVVAGIVLVLVLAFVFSLAQGTRKTTSNALALNSAGELLQATNTAQAQLARASLVGNVDQLIGSFSPDAIALSVDEARAALVQLNDALGEHALEREVPAALTSAAVTFAEEVGVGLDLVKAGRMMEAEAFIEESVTPVFRTLRIEIARERAQLNAAVEASDDFLRWLELLARFLVAFLVPTAVIVIYREFMRRQQRQGELEGRLETERALGKAREDFIANASHELRTPLTSIYGLALLLEEDPVFSESDTGKEMVGMIISESSDLSRMVEDLLTTARLDAGALHFTFENVRTTDEIEEVVGPLQRAGQVIETRVAPAMVRADRLRLRQVLRNLLSNARKYGGPNIHIDGEVVASKYVFTVRDDGEGIPVEMEERLFQRYFHQGTQPMVLGAVGLGLSIVAALTKGMGGDVSYRHENGWTEFIVSVPLVLDETLTSLKPIGSDSVGTGLIEIAGDEPFQAAA
ncbi:MAG: HAMP domain-containing histidine kinase [Acidimicrobiia bacterium]|nr:HAMP domain-containing histidine kinase [Acidimicrobiia bacterium]